MNVFIKGLNGCWMRKTDIQRYRDFFSKNGHSIVDNPAQSDIVILWTCAFRQDYKDNSLSQIDHYQKEYHAEVVVAGCLPDIDSSSLQQHFSGKILSWRDDETVISQIFPGSNELRDIQRNVCENKLCDDVAEYRKQYPDRPASFADQFTKLHISEGCRFECTYCSERLAFPQYRSFSVNSLIETCRKSIEATGYKKIMLLGDSIGDYGHDIGSSLPELIQRLIMFDLSIALHGLNPAHFIKYYDDFTGLLLKGHISHISLPIQSASNRILHLMNRSYMHEEIERIFNLFHDIGFSQFETHIIIGFPGECEEDFEKTLDFVLRHRPTYVLASGFMEASGAPAAQLPDKVDAQTKRHRLRILEERLRADGIICNTDDSELSAARFHALNYVD